MHVLRRYGARRAPQPYNVEVVARVDVHALDVELDASVARDVERERLSGGQICAVPEDRLVPLALQSTPHGLRVNVCSLCRDQNTYHLISIVRDNRTNGSPWFDKIVWQIL